MDKIPQCYTFISDEEIVITSGYVYGLCSYGWKPFLKRPIQTLLCGTFFWAPLCAFGTAFICSLVPRETIRVIPFLFAGSIIYKNFYKKNQPLRRR